MKLNYSLPYSLKIGRFYGVVNEPLLEGDEDLELIFWVFIPGLHVFMGIVNTVFDYLYKHMIEDIENGEFHASVYEWALAKNIVGLDYRGGQLDGPNANRLLKNIDSLVNFLPEKFRPYAECLKLFDLVKKSCFGTVLDESNYLKYITDFEKAYRDLPIPVTPKAHLVFYEIPIFIQRTNKPLGYVHEQSFETVNHDTKAPWQDFKRKEDSPEFAAALENYMVNYNSWHLR